MKWMACPGSTVSCSQTVSTSEEFTFCQVKPVRCGPTPKAAHKRRLARPSSSLYLGLNRNPRDKAISNAENRHSNSADRMPATHATNTSFVRTTAIRVKKFKPYRNVQFDQLLNNKLGISAFRGFLSSEHSVDNLDFWLECERYRTSASGRLQMLGKSIVKNFLEPGCPCEVNLNFVSRRLAQSKGVCGERGAFLVVQNAIYRLMCDDSFRRFSNDYSTLLPYLESFRFLEPRGRSTPKAPRAKTRKFCYEPSVYV